MSKLSFVILTLVFFSRAQAFGLKGVEVGAPYDSAAINAVFGSADDGAVGLAGVIAGVHSTEYKGNLLEIDATFPTYGFAPIKAALVAKYGKPKSSVALPMVNAYGARVTSYVLTWRNAAGDEMVLMSAIGEIGTGSLSIKSAVQVSSEKQASAKDSGI